MNELITRSLSGVIYVALIFCAIYLDSNTLFLLVFSLIAFIAHWEYAALLGHHRTRPLRVIFDGLASVYSIVLLGQIGNGPVILLYLLLSMSVYSLYIIIRGLYSGRENQPKEIAQIFFGHAYITLPLAIATFLHSSLEIDNLALLTIATVSIWANDTGAYLVGSRFGKNRLFPSLSPKKSWEGFFGGLIFSTITAWLLNKYLFASSFMPTMSLILGVVVSIASTWGDLFESLLKRNAGVKDSGKLIPGHGGILDRIDSMLFVYPIVFLCYAIGFIVF